MPSFFCTHPFHNLILQPLAILTQTALFPILFQTDFGSSCNAGMLMWLEAAKGATAAALGRLCLALKRRFQLRATRCCTSKTRVGIAGGLSRL